MARDTDNNKTSSRKQTETKRISSSAFLSVANFLRDLTLIVHAFFVLQLEFVPNGG